MSVSFLALHETLKSDPKMINIISKIRITNDREQYKDNNNTNYSAINIFNPINDSILDLSKSITKNRLETFTNNAKIFCSFTLIPGELPVITATSSPCIICVSG